MAAGSSVAPPLQLRTLTGSGAGSSSGVEPPTASVAPLAPSEAAQAPARAPAKPLGKAPAAALPAKPLAAPKPPPAAPPVASHSRVVEPNIIEPLALEPSAAGAFVYNAPHHKSANECRAHGCKLVHILLQDFCPAAQSSDREKLRKLVRNGRITGTDKVPKLGDVGCGSMRSGWWWHEGDPHLAIARATLS